MQERRAHHAFAAFLAAAVFLVFAVGTLPKHLPPSHAMMGEGQPVAFCVSHCLSTAQADHAVSAVVVAVGASLAAVGILSVALPRLTAAAVAEAAPAARQRLRDVSSIVLRE